MKKYYLAYGSNLNIPQMRFRCPTAEIIGTAELKGWELLFRGSKTGSYLTIGEKPDSVVPVAVWAVGSGDELALDRYEGFPMFYYKKDVQVDCEMLEKDGFIYRYANEIKSLDAFVYIMHEDRPIGVPSLYYMNVCLDGYKSFGFDSDVLWRAYDRSKEAV